MNPLVKFSSVDSASVPIAELKQHVLLFTQAPPGPKTVRRVFDLYFETWGDPFSKYASTAFGSRANKWNDEVLNHFFSVELPMLRKNVDWGYTFSDGRNTDSWMFKFHGYRPYAEHEKVSFYRFEFDWQVDPEKLKKFANDLLDIVTCFSGCVGYVFQGRPTGSFARSSFNQIFAWARRYWCIEAQDLDVTVNYMAGGYKCVNWITIIGEALTQLNPEAVEYAKKVAYEYERKSGGGLFQASKVPIFGDRHRMEAMSGYIALAKALESIQVQNHGAFGEGSGSRWTEENTNAWLRRFTDPENVV